MKGISQETNDFLDFAFNEYLNALDHELVSAFLDGREEDEFYMDNIQARLHSDSKHAILAETDVRFIQHVCSAHETFAANGFGSLWKATPEEDMLFFARVINEVKSAQEAEKGRWMTYEGYSGTYQVVPKLGIYENGHNLYLCLDAFDQDFGGYDFFADITVNLDYGTMPYLHSAIDTNNNGQEVIEFLEKNGFGQSTGVRLPSGYISFPMFQFNEQKLREIDPQVFEEYAKNYGVELPPLSEKMEAAEKKRSVEHSSHPESKDKDDR